MGQKEENVPSTDEPSTDEPVSGMVHIGHQLDLKAPCEVSIAFSPAV